MKVQTVSNTMTNEKFAAYESWATTQASIEAPKVALRDDSEKQRGLFATNTIHPGERILFLPAKSLIGNEMLQNVGRAVIDSFSSRQEEPVSLEEWEQFVIGTIEEVRQMVIDDLIDPVVQEAAQNVGYRWREDDGVALYLVLCRHLLQTVVSEESMNKESKERKTKEAGSPILQAQDGPDLPLTEAVPIGEVTEPVLHHPEVEPTVVVEETTPEPELDYPSFFEYIAMLPDSFPTSPLYYTAEELSKIEGTNCHGYTTRMLNQMESDCYQLTHVLSAYQQSSHRQIACPACRRNSGSDCWCSKLNVSRVFNLEAYKWALCNIYSRSTDFHRRTDEGTERLVRVIAPLFDMMNHDFQSDVSHAMDTEGNLSVYNGSTGPIEEGDEILLCYGKFPNEKFLLIYGFALPDNPYDAVSIYAPIRSSDPLHQVKARILHSKCGIEDTNEPHTLYASQKLQGRPILPSSLLSVLRVVGIQSADEVLALASQDRTEDGSIAMISTENERSALSALQEALYGMARRIALNLISDENLHAASTVPLQSQNDSPQGLRKINSANAKILCQSEYNIIQAALTELVERLHALDGEVIDQQ